MKKKNLVKFYVITWNINSNKIEHYDVMPYFRDCYERRRQEWKRKQKSKRFQKDIEKGLITEKDIENYYKAPETYDEFKRFVESESRYMFWARCEWEVIVTDWPVGKGSHKMDVHEQVMMNIDVICRILWDEINA